MDEGRLDFAEYDDRLNRAYRAVTYGDLDELFADLPASTTAGLPAPVTARPGAVPAPRRMPTALRVLWTIWASVVAVNLTVWLLVSIDDGGPDYFWPMWLLVPGAVLFAVSVAVGGARATRTPGRRED
jgi:hypothetical protein